MSADLSIASVIFATLLPMGVFIVAWMLERHRVGRHEKPPQQEKLLRPPGYSLALRLESLQDRVLDDILVACILCSGGGVSALTLGLLLGNEFPIVWPILILILFLAFSGLGAWRVMKALRNWNEARNVRLGLRGEQAVAEALHETGSAGYRIFHDLQTERFGNIDHVAVGALGVFAIETKARRRRGSRNGKLEHVVSYDGKGLDFPTGYDAESIPQAIRNAGWLADYLSKRTAESVAVEAVVAIPGWYVETRGNFPVKVMNASYLAKYLRGQGTKFNAAQVQRIVAALDDKCRDVEF